ncbi:MAG TPA: type II toxin-antitoxin system VapC family toxin [Gaiella sp.]|nr:type II toxin-antitoxin system VapC family toxin [Gaiella sp.]
MRFWDASAVVPLLLEEARSETMRAESAERPQLVVWWGTVVECTSAISRRERSGALEPSEATEALETLDRLTRDWREVPPTPTLRDDAQRLVRVHDLRARDALQLAAARIAADGEPGALPFVTLDERLALAASREGFPLLGAG